MLRWGYKQRVICKPYNAQYIHIYSMCVIVIVAQTYNSSISRELIAIAALFTHDTQLVSKSLIGMPKHALLRQYQVFLFPFGTWRYRYEDVFDGRYILLASMTSLVIEGLSLTSNNKAAYSILVQTTARNANGDQTNCNTTCLFPWSLTWQSALSTIFEGLKVSQWCETAACTNALSKVKLLWLKHCRESMWVRIRANVYFTL